MDEKQRDKLISDAERGEAFISWKLDDCTQLMLEYLQTEAEKAQRGLLNIKPTDVDGMYEAQSTARVYLEMVRVIDGFINKGRMAIDYLRASEEDAPVD